MRPTRADATILRFDHPAYQSLGASASDLQVALRALFDEVLSVDDTCDIRAYIQQQRALGNDRFGAMVEQKLGRCASLRPPHRPPLRRGLQVRHSDPVFSFSRFLLAGVTQSPWKRR